MSRHFIRKLSVTLVAAAAFATGADASAFTKPPFPRIGGYDIGGPFNYNDPTYQANLAKQSVMVLGMYNGLAPGGQPMNTAIQAIKAKNPNALIFLYAHSDGAVPSETTGASASYVAKMNAMKWWLYSDKALTQQVKNFYGSEYTINNTMLTPKDSDGNTSVDWITKYFVNSFYKPNPAVDGLYMDNTSVRAWVDGGDWSRNGTVESKSDPQAGTWVRQGYARYYKLLATSLMPGKYQIGNVGTWGDLGPVPTEYQNLTNGGVLEGYIGPSYAIESWGGWQEMMARYNRIMDAFLQPKLGIFNQHGNPTDYQSMRYGLASCLLNDGYFSFTDTSQGYHGVVWFDEYDSKLGQATSLPPTAAWKSGVWRRDFENGISLVNPKGNGPQTVTLETAYVKLKGTQDPVTNNGQTVTTVTLKDRDGIILLRKNPVKRPAAPQKLTSQS